VRVQSKIYRFDRSWGCNGVLRASERPATSLVISESFLLGGVGGIGVGGWWLSCLSGTTLFLLWDSPETFFHLPELSFENPKN
jgi:hypothetical protein